MTDEGWIKAEREHEYAMADMKSKDAYRQREALTTRIGYVSFATAVIGVVAILALLTYMWQESNGKRNREVEQACIAAGGTWTTIGGGTSKTCVHLAEVKQ